MSKPFRPLIVGLGGTPRSGSMTEKALRLSLIAAAEAGADIEILTGPDLILPLYVPGDPDRGPATARLTEAYRRCDGIIIATPAYHGSLSGVVKNALDYVEDLRDHSRIYFDGLPIGLVVCAGGWQAAGQTLTTLRGIAHALRGWPTPLGAALNTATPLFDETGICLDLSARMQLQTVGQQVVEFAKLRGAHLARAASGFGLE
jgi:FMN reductase